MKVTQSLLSLLVLWGGIALTAAAASRGPNVSSGADAPPGGEDDPPKYTIVIDAGHGGRDLGTRGDEHHEKDLALELALSLGRRLEERPSGDVQVIYTRTTDVFVPLHERAEVANTARADLFVSIHCNYLESREDWHGSETYVMGLHTADHNLGVAKRENAVVALEADNPALHYDFDPESPAGHIMLSHFQHAHLERSLAAAVELEESLGARPGRRSHGVKQAGFVVLKEATVPSVLVEVGYLSNDAEEAYLGSEQGIVASAAALYHGVLAYLRALEDGPRARTVTDRVEANAALRPSDGPSAPEEAQRREATSLYVQLAASATALPTTESERWRRLGTEVRVLREGNLLKYQAGPYGSPSAARSARALAETLGFEGAFVLGYRGNTRLSPAELSRIK